MFNLKSQVLSITALHVVPFAVLSKLLTSLAWAKTTLQIISNIFPVTGSYAAAQCQWALLPSFSFLCGQRKVYSFQQLWIWYFTLVFNNEGHRLFHGVPLEHLREWEWKLKREEWIFDPSSPYSISRNQTAWICMWLSSQLCLRAVLDTSFVAPLATSFVSIYLVTPLCGHPPYASSHMFFILYHSQAGLVPQLLFVFATVIHFPPCSWSYATQNCIDCMVLLVSQRFLWFFICACSFLSQLQQRTGKWLTQ